MLLGALEGAAPDPNDAGHAAPARRRRIATTRRHLKRDGLKGARIGIPRAFYYDKHDACPATRSRAAA